MALTPGQLAYWRNKTGNPKLTMAQAQALHTQATAAPAAPATVQVPNAPATPFLTGEQILEQGQAQQAHDTGYQNIADQLAQLALNNQYQKQAIEQGRVKGVSGAQDDAAARGVFNSSIKDGNVADVDAQAATAQQHLVDNMAAAQASASAQRAILDNALAASTTGFNQAAVENASAIDTGYSTQPAPAAGAPGGAPKPPAPPKVTGAAPTATGGHPQGQQQTVASAGTFTGTAAPQQTPGYHAGHSIGHEFYLPGVGWVSRARYQAGA